MSKYLYILFFLVALSIASCNNDYPNGAEYENYQFTNLDQKAGTWKPILLTSNDQISIPAPEPTTSEAYLSELKTMKTTLASASSNAAYWGCNPIIRWNEIARDLAAKYNLTPAPNDDGTYPSPSAANPGVYPYFPFAHPPYASRAFAYLSAAQFDGLIATWHYKYKYNRPAVHITDPSIVPVFHASDLPSYPSDGAVIAAISREILGAMFPLEKEFLKIKAEEMQKSLIYSGINVSSDIIAGDSLGKGVAKVYLKRAVSDGMALAQTNRQVSDSIANAALARFGWKWINQESPVRPVGVTPRFGKVKMWNVPNVESVRPGPPPVPGSAAFNAAVEELKSIAKNSTKEQRKIANWWSDGLGTYTPPGHWNRFATNFIIDYKMNPIRSARVFAYLNMAIQDAGISCWDSKYYYHYPRPIQLMEGFKTSLGTPNFPSYTSEHSTFSAAAATVLSYLFPNEKAKCDKWATEASESRIYGGIHFRFDCEAGLEAGKKIGEYAIQKALVDGAD